MIRRGAKLVLYSAPALFGILTGFAASSDHRIQPDRVAYTSFQPASNWDIYLFTQRVQAPRRLTDYPGLDYDPVVSPDGRWLVFCSERRGNPDLYVLDLQRGGDPRLLIDSDFLEDQAAFSPDGKFIVFVSTFSGNADIYRLPFRPDKTLSMKQAENLTHHPSGHFRPAISPDGRMLAFSSDRDLPITVRSVITRHRSGDIWTLNLIDKTLRRLTTVTGTGWNGSPKWSADGKEIVFYSSQFGSAPPGNQQSRIWVMSADGSNPHAVTVDETAALSPDFLPGGRIIYSRRNKQNLEEIVSVNGDGSGAAIESDSSKNSYRGPSRGPSHGPAQGTFVAYGTGPVEPEPADGYHRSPVELGIVRGGPVLVPGAPFRRTLPDRQIDLYPIRYFTAILNPRENLILHIAPSAPSTPVELWASRIDGSRQHKLLELEPSPTQQTFSGMSFSKDGQWIAFTRGGGPGSVKTATSEADVWKMRADKSDLQNLTPHTPGFDGYPSFSGDGKQIVFRSGRNGNLNLYLMNSDGSNVRRLTDDDANDLFPVFSPTANQIAFASNRDHPTSDIFDIYLLDLDANGAPGKIRRITHDEGQHGHLQYSYDGKWLIFASERGGISDEQPIAPSPQLYGELYAYRIKDGTMIRLTHNKWEEGVPSWEAPLGAK
jgi:Tol biopolymer transport system component